MNRLSRLLLVIPLTVLLAACAGGQVRHGAAPHAAPLIAADASPATDTAAADEAIADADVAPPAPDLPAVPTADPASAAEGIDSAAAPTQAEHDFALLYGGEPYDPVADADLPDPALLQIAHDPWEPFNRRMHALNNMMDRNVGLPLARAYVATVPRPVRLGVGNFFVNLGQPVSALNALLQGRPGHAAEALARFLVNATLGVGGLFDPASRMGLTLRSEDFGQTLAIWGWERSRYLELPLFGPRTLRDVFGMAGDAPLSPMQHIGDDNARIVLQGLMLVDIRTQLMSVDSMRQGAADEYALVRDAWMQRRNYQIHGERRGQQDHDNLPDYLQDDDELPMLPAGAIPVLLPGTP